jgi:hypothetical protein
LSIEMLLAQLHLPNFFSFLLCNVARMVSA